MIVLDEESAAINALGLERYRPLAPEVASAVEVAVEEVGVQPSRKEYMRELMRRLRAEKAAKKRGEG